MKIYHNVYKSISKKEKENLKINHTLCCQNHGIKSSYLDRRAYYGFGGQLERYTILLNSWNPCQRDP